MNKQPVTIKYLARKLRISVSTVSRALRDLPDVNPETKRAVKALAKQLNYEPNYIAQSLINRRSKVIGVIVPAISAPVFGRILTGMYDTAHNNGYQLMICHSNESAESETDLVRQLISFKVDGLVISVSGETKDKAPFEVLKRKDIPVIFFDRVLTDFPTSKVLVNEFKSAFLAVEHLIKHGCQKIFHLGGPSNLSISKDRANGYIAAIEKYNLGVNSKYIFECKRFEDDALEALKQLILINGNPDGIFAINDASAIIALKYLSKRGIRVPEDVALVGCNNDPISEVVSPSLSSIELPAYEIGSQTIELLLKHLRDSDFPPQTITLTSKLIKRESSKRQTGDC